MQRMRTDGGHGERQQDGEQLEMLCAKLMKETLVDRVCGRAPATGSKVKGDSGTAPEGWFFLRETTENRVLNRELVAAGLVELGNKIEVGRRTVQLARVKRG